MELPTKWVFRDRPRAMPRCAQTDPANDLCAAKPALHHQAGASSHAVLEAAQSSERHPRSTLHDARDLAQVRRSDAHQTRGFQVGLPCQAADVDLRRRALHLATHFQPPSRTAIAHQRGQAPDRARSRALEASRAPPPFDRPIPRARRVVDARLKQVLEGVNQ